MFSWLSQRYSAEVVLLDPTLRSAMPAWLDWLLPLPVATLAAVAWTTWVSRPRAPVQPYDSVQAYERFRQAMTTPVPGADGPVPKQPRVR